MKRDRAVVLLIATRKGAFLLRSDGDRGKWELSEPIMLGHIVHHLVQDPRGRETILMAARTGHLGPTVFVSRDAGASWTEAKQPPMFAKEAGGLSVDHVFWLTPGHRDEPGVWYAGTSPQGLFQSCDGGETWTGVDGFNRHPMRSAWATEGTPDGAKLHSILVDPRDPKHLYFGMSGGGVFESTDAGADWRPLNRGCLADFLPDPDPEYGHDPHCVRLHPLKPDRLYQQNHCGIYRMDRPDDKWVRIGLNMPKAVGDIGFPLALHPRDPERLWVFPMDGTTVWPRTSPDGRPAAYSSRDGGETWTRHDHGLPERNAWFTVKRQAMTADECDPVGVYFGATHGEVWGSIDEGESWNCLARYLPHIYSVEAAHT